MFSAICVALACVRLQAVAAESTRRRLSRARFGSSPQTLLVNNIMVLCFMYLPCVGSVEQAGNNRAQPVASRKQQTGASLKPPSKLFSAPGFDH